MNYTALVMCGHYPLHRIVKELGIVYTNENYLSDTYKNKGWIIENLYFELPIDLEVTYVTSDTLVKRTIIKSSQVDITHCFDPHASPLVVTLNTTKTIGFRDYYLYSLQYDFQNTSDKFSKTIPVISIKKHLSVGEVSNALHEIGAYSLTPHTITSLYKVADIDIQPLLYYSISYLGEEYVFYQKEIYFHHNQSAKTFLYSLVDNGAQNNLLSKLADHLNCNYNQLKIKKQVILDEQFMLI